MNERGAVLVEAIFVLPVMLVLTFGAIEFGIAYNQKGNLEAATRAGARVGATIFSTPENPPFNNQMAHQVFTAVNAALLDGTTPGLKHLYIYKYGLPNPDTNGCGIDCVSYPVDPGNQNQFLDNPGGGGWPLADRNGCGLTPDKISVEIVGEHSLITKMIPAIPDQIDISSTSTLQFEPNACP